MAQGPIAIIASREHAFPFWPYHAAPIRKMGFAAAIWNQVGSNVWQY